MKRIIAGVLTVLMLSTALVGCGSSNPAPQPAAPQPAAAQPAAAQPAAPQPAAPQPAAPAPSAPEKKIRIGVAFATEVATRFKFDEKFMKQKADELGCELLVQWANYDATKQENQVENLISQGIDALIFIGVSNNMSPLIKKVKAEGIPVIAYDQFILEAPVDAYLDRDNYEAGLIQIEAAIKATGGKGNFAILKGDPTSSVAQTMGEAYTDTLAKYPDIKVVAEQFHEGWSAEKALKTAENALSANNDQIDAFVCSADVLALGIMPAVKASQLEGKVFISGMDCEIPAMQLIDQGIMNVSVWTKIDEMGLKAVQAAYNLVNGLPVEADEIVKSGEYEIPKIKAPIIGITKDNLEDWVDKIAPEGWIKREDVFVN